MAGNRFTHRSRECCLYKSSLPTRVSSSKSLFPPSSAACAQVLIHSALKVISFWQDMLCFIYFVLCCFGHQKGKIINLHCTVLFKSQTGETWTKPFNHKLVRKEVKLYFYSTFQNLCYKVLYRSLKETLEKKTQHNKKNNKNNTVQDKSRHSRVKKKETLKRKTVQGIPVQKWYTR